MFGSFINEWGNHMQNLVLKAQTLAQTRVRGHGVSEITSVILCLHLAIRTLC